MENMENIDPTFECDAPRFIDFALFRRGELEDDANADTWFDTQPGSDGGIFVTDENEGDILEITKEEAKKIMSASQPSAPKLAFEDHFVESQSEINKEEEVTSEEAAVTGSREEPTSSQVTTEIDAGNNSEPLNDAPETSVARKPDVVMPTSKPPLQKTKPDLPQCTLPRTPECVRRYQMKQMIKASHVKSSEDRELETIAKKRKESIQVLQISKHSYNKLLQAPGTKCIQRSRIPKCTKIEEFKFSSSKGNRKPSGEKIPPKHHSQFQMSLRSGKKASFKRTESVEVKPFNVATSIPQKEKGNFVSVAEAIANFHKKTPPRFHQKSNKEVPAASRPTLGLTQAQSPCLHTKSRARPANVESKEEKEEKEMVDYQKHQFRARPLNRKILEVNYMGIVREQNRPPTQAVSPKLATASRLTKRKESECQPQEKEYQFKASDAPKDILEAPKGIPRRSCIPVTKPQSPSFASKKRRVNMSSDIMNTTQSSDHSDASSETSKAVFKPLLEHKHTIPRPFSYETRHQNDKTRAERVKHILAEEQKFEFHANPVPDLTCPSSKPQGDRKPSCTKVQPFSLQTENRGTKHQEEMEEKLRREMEEERQRKLFKATESNVVHNKPFIPKHPPSRAPLLEIKPFNLNTEKRAKERAGLDEERKRIEEDNQRRLAAEQDELAQQENLQLMEYRKKLVHNAQPVRHFKPMTVTRSDRPVTQPQELKFACEDRVLRRAAN